MDLPFENDKSDSLQNIAIKLVEEHIRLLQIESGPRERTLFVLGSQGVGKSTAINRFFDREEIPKPTLALEYSFGRRSGQVPNTARQILNVWELGSLDNAEQLIEVPIKSHGIENFSAIILLDLTQTNRLWCDLELALQGLKNAFAKNSSELQITELRKLSEERFGKEHPDLSSLEIIPFPIVIAGGKYDIFQNFDPEIKKHVCRFLRSISHAIGASLLFYSNKIANLSKTLRDTISHLGFGSPSNPFRSTLKDYNGPLVIWFGHDSWKDIGISATNSERIGLSYKTNIQSEAGQLNDDKEDKKNKSLISDDPAHDPGFKETLIDDMRAQKDEELLNLIRDTEIRRNFETVV